MNKINGFAFHLDAASAPAHHRMSFNPSASATGNSSKQRCQRHQRRLFNSSRQRRTHQYVTQKFALYLKGNKKLQHCGGACREDNVFPFYVARVHGFQRPLLTYMATRSRLCKVSNHIIFSWGIFIPGCSHIHFSF